MRNHVNGLTHHRRRSHQRILPHILRKIPNKRVLRMQHHIGRRSGLYDRTVTHYRDPVTDVRRLTEIMGDEDDRLVHRGLSLHQLFLQVTTDHRVQRAERLVHQHHRCVHRERARKTDPLFHAAAQLVGHVAFPPT